MSDKLQKLGQLMLLLQNDTLTPKQVEQFLSLMIQAIKRANDDFKSLSAENIQKLQEALDSIATHHAYVLKQIDQKNQQAMGDTHKRMGEIMAALETAKQLRAIPGPQGDLGPAGKDGNPGKDGSPDTGEQILDKLHSLPDEDEYKIDVTRIKNIPTGKGRYLHGGFKNPRIYSGGVLVAKAIQAIKYSGAGVTATLGIDGSLTVTIPGGSGTATDELATDSGDHTTFTISHTPVAGTLLVINENTGQAVPSSAYTNTTTSIIFNASQQVDDGAGNLVTPTFRARYFY
jgi:hypothetical protein